MQIGTIQDGKPRVGLALGSGSARGWAHIGVIHALTEAGVVPDVVCGTSIGAVVGAAYVDGDLDRLEHWVKALTWQGVVGFLDLSLGGGLIKGERLVDYFRRTFSDAAMEQLKTPFAAVATDLETGAEVWLREGLVLDAVRASIALPGLFTPVLRGGRILVDGGLVNPVPVSVCRAMGADVVIAVDLNSNLVGRHLKPPVESDAAADGKAAGSWLQRLSDGIASLGWSSPEPQQRTPSLLEVIASSVNIMQMRITRSRLAGDPADVLIAPRLAHVGLMDFHRAATCIEAGRNAARHALPLVRELCQLQNRDR